MWSSLCPLIEFPFVAFPFVMQQPFAFPLPPQQPPSYSHAGQKIVRNTGHDDKANYIHISLPQRLYDRHPKCISMVTYGFIARHIILTLELWYFSLHHSRPLTMAYDLI